MLALLRRYTQWLHTRWPAGTIEKLPYADEDGATNVAGLYIAGDLTGIPLLKFSSDTGAKAVRRILADPSFMNRKQLAGKSGAGALDLVIVGAGVAGMAAALEAQKAGLEFQVLEAAEPFSTIVNFPRRKPIYTYPTGMTPAGDLQFSDRSDVKEGLLEELRELTLGRGIRPRKAHVEKVQRRGGLLEVVLSSEPPVVAHRVIVAIGRSGNFRKLGVPGEDLDKVANRLHDPMDFSGQDVLVVGGGDSALETAIALAQCGARVTLSYRKPEFSRPKPDNIEKLQALAADPGADVSIEEPVSDRVTTAAGGFLEAGREEGSIRLMSSSHVRMITGDHVEIERQDGSRETLANDAVFSMIGREAPLEFFRRSGVRILGEWRASTWVGLGGFLAFCVFLYNWKAGGDLYKAFEQAHWFPFNVPGSLEGLGGMLGAWLDAPANLLGTVRISAGSPGFWYSLAYCLCVVIFGVIRIRKRRTPYITAQTLVLMAIQVVPLFLLPYVLLPWAGHNGWFDAGTGRWLADQLFPQTQWDPQGREYWRAFGLVLAWPLFLWNVFTWQPMGLWLGISAAQTLVLIPLIIYFWGKGAYCGWICSCGALAETLGDAHRHKMPHGPVWNRLNMVGQGVLAAALVLLGLRVAGWIWPGSLASVLFDGMLNGWKLGVGGWRVQLNYYWWVDVMLAGILGVGLYFWFSGRVWCRFACPLAALMHVYTRFSRFRILSEKKKCISCNVCTSVCHQGIDVMNFANKGLPMADPECVRCSACVQSCPTGTLSFGQIRRRDGQVIRKDRLAASPVLMEEAD